MTEVLAALGLLANLILTFLGVLWSRHRRGIRASRGHLALGRRTDSNTSPRDCLVALSESIRDALILQLGTACRAKTTEELSTDDRVEQLLGDQCRTELIRFLDQIDHLKFAPERSGNHHEALQEALTNWTPRVETLQAKIRARQRRQAQPSPPGRPVVPDD